MQTSEVLNVLIYFRSVDTYCYHKPIVLVLSIIVIRNIQISLQ